MNFVPCVMWVKRGVTKEIPERVQLSKLELKKLIEESITDIKELNMEENAEEVEIENKDASTSDDTQKMDAERMENDSDDDFETKYNLGSYDDEETSTPVFSVGQLVDFSSERKGLGNAETEQEFSSEKFDKTENEQPYDSDDEDNYRIRPLDNLITVGHVTKDCSTLEVYVYNEEDDDLYVHHDIILPAFPISMEWVNYGPKEDSTSNFLAIGDMTPVINIWDLDMVDIIEPIATLGRKLKKKERKLKKGSSGEHGHGDAVLDLSWNKHLGHALASGSADHSVILWDLTTTAPVTHLRHHTEKVQCVEWHPFEAEILLTGACDKRVVMYDARAIEEKKSWTINEEVERLVWNHCNPFCFLAGTDEGNIYCIDVRHNDPVFSIDAHNKGISDLSLSSSCPGLLVSTGSFTSVKIWDIRNNQPKLVDSKKLKEGNILACRGSPDSPFTFAVGGDKPSSNIIRVLNLLNYETVRNHFAPDSVAGKVETKPVSTVDGESAVASCSWPSGTRTNLPTGQKILKKKTMSKKKWK